jgi:hypothetical protein
MIGIGMRTWTAWIFTVALALGAAHPRLGQVQKVYLMAMSSGYDQYLANQLTSQGVYEVVTDPKLADAVLTESLGSVFETRLAELVAPPPEPKAKKTDEEILAGASGNSTPMRTSAFSRGRGNLFLVDVKSHSVVWSTYLLPKDRSANQLDKASRRVITDLARDKGSK